MKIGVVSNAAYSLPLLQTLVSNNIQASVFADACIDEQADLVLITHFCNQMRIPIQSTGSDALYFWLEETRPDMVFVMGFRHLIDVKQVPESLRKAMYNIHFGPLPAYRGPNPVFWQIRNGEQQLGVAIHHINEKFDAGAVVWTKQLKREPFMSFGAANTLLSQVVIEGAGHIIQSAVQRKALPVLQQDSKGSHYYKRPQLQDVLINWETMSAVQIINLVLACNPWNKGAIIPYNGREVKLLDAGLSESKTPIDNKLAPGTIVGINNTLQVVCKDGVVIDVYMLIVDGTFVPGRYAATWGFTQGQRMMG